MKTDLQGKPVWVESFCEAGEERYRVVFRFAAMVNEVEYSVMVPRHGLFVYKRVGSTVEIYGETHD